MLLKTKASTACCNTEMYVSYLLSEPQYTSCTRFAKIMGNLSHDSVNRFLERERYEPKDLFDEEKEKIELKGGTVSVDDSVLDKPYSEAQKVAFIDYFWSGKHKQVVKGLNLITLFYKDIKGICVPVNYRIVDKSSGKTKNDYFREMLLEVICWGLQPSCVTGDSWYSSLGNLKFIRQQGFNFMFGIESNRLISIERGQYIQVQTLEDWPEDGKTVYLKEYGMVKVFRQIYKKVYHYYMMGVAKLENLAGIKQTDFERKHEDHWNIERFHRAIKQVCNIERFQVRRENPIKNHIFCALKAFVRLEFMRLHKIISHWYEIKRDLFIGAIRHFVVEYAKHPQFVNA
jgi:hypothetical protein